ncbi:MAG: two-component regulator propeller domain-containing protein [Syntrophothermus sp.]
MNEGERWIGTNNGLVKMSGQTIQKIFNKTNSGLTDNHIKDMAFDYKGTAWIATFETGLVKYKPK